MPKLLLPSLRRALAAFLISLLFTGLVQGEVPTAPPAPTTPALMLAKVYRPGMDLADYWVSEKFDGLRGYWDGTQLWTRGGEPVHAPAWFTEGWPTVAMDGELWAGRDKFSQASSTVRARLANDAAWRGLKFMVFDLPHHPGTFNERLPVLQTTVAQIQHPWVVAVAQTHVKDHAALQALLHRTVKAGGEGLMLHRGGSLYKAARNDDLLKVKLHDDAEAVVLAHQAGQGQHRGHLGALWVQTVASGNGPAPGLRLKIGSGLTDALRRAPPAVGSTITYRYRGLTTSGLPRFATFVRVVPVQSEGS